jgi:DNA-binding ferritin-like protein
MKNHPTKNSLKTNVKSVAIELLNARVADIFTEVFRGLDKALWFLEAHVQE